MALGEYTWGNQEPIPEMESRESVEHVLKQKSCVFTAGNSFVVILISCLFGFAVLWFSIDVLCAVMWCGSAMRTQLFRPRCADLVGDCRIPVDNHSRKLLDMGFVRLFFPWAFATAGFAHKLMLLGFQSSNAEGTAQACYEPPKSMAFVLAEL